MVPELRHQALVEGAFFAALTAIVALLGLYIPPLFFLSSLVAPLPLAVLVRRRDLKTGAMALVVAGFLLLMLSGRPLAVLMVIVQMGPLGLLLGLLFKNHVSAGTSVMLAGIVSVIITLISLGLTFGIAGINSLVMSQEMRQSIEQVLYWYQQRGLVNPVAEQEFRRLINEAIQLIGLLLPANLAIWSLISTFITYSLGRLIFQRLGYTVPPLPPFSRWRFPWYLIWGLILGLGLVMGGDTLGLVRFVVAGKNLLYVSNFLYLILGLSIACFYTKKWNLSRLVKFLLIGVFFLYWPFAVIILSTLGLLDSLFNIRQLNSEGTKAKGE